MACHPHFLPMESRKPGTNSQPASPLMGTWVRKAVEELPFALIVLGRGMKTSASAKSPKEEELEAEEGKTKPDQNLLHLTSSTMAISHQGRYHCPAPSSLLLSIAPSAFFHILGLESRCRQKSGGESQRVSSVCRRRRRGGRAGWQAG